MKLALKMHLFVFDVITTVISKMKACEKFRCEWHLNSVVSDIVAVLHQLSHEGTVAGSLWVMFMINYGPANL